MMNSEDLARYLSNYIHDSETLFKVVDTILGPPQVKRPEHDALVNEALSGVVFDFMVKNKKIQAIKELRSVTHVSLKAAKEAVEDERVTDAVNLQLLRDKLAGVTALTPFDEYKECEHGLSAHLCSGPNHYPEDEPF